MAEQHPIFTESREFAQSAVHVQDEAFPQSNYTALCPLSSFTVMWEVAYTEMLSRFILLCLY